MTSPAIGKFGCGYLVLWFLIFAVAIFAGDPVMIWLVDVLSTAPLPVVVVVSWLPFGLMFFFFLADAMQTTAPPMRQPWVTLLAVTGLICAVQVPVILRRERGASDAYLEATASATGWALIAGVMGAFGTVLLWTLVFQTWRWTRGRFRGEELRFMDNSWGMQPMSRRRFAVGAAVSALLGLVVALAAV